MSCIIERGGKNVAGMIMGSWEVAMWLERKGGGGEIERLPSCIGGWVWSVLQNNGPSTKYGAMTTVLEADTTNMGNQIDVSTMLERFCREFLPRH